MTMNVSSAQAQNKVSMVMSGGPFYNDRDIAITDLKNSGFNTFVLWTLDVDEKGNLNFNGELPLFKEGRYVGDAARPHFKDDIASLKKGSTNIKRIEFSIMRNWPAIQTLIEKHGVGPDSNLYKNFKGLKSEFPDLDAISSNDEGHYDFESTTKFAIMLADLGFKFTLSPYRKKSYWNKVVTTINDKIPGTVDAIYVQGYDGGANNDPCDWELDGIPAYGSDWIARSSLAIVKARMSTWQQSCGSSGGWLFLYDDFVGDAATYAETINSIFNVPSN